VRPKAEKSTWSAFLTFYRWDEIKLKLSKFNPFKERMRVKQDELL